MFRDDVTGAGTAKTSNKSISGGCGLRREHDDDELMRMSKSRQYVDQLKTSPRQKNCPRHVRSRGHHTHGLASLPKYLVLTDVGRCATSNDSMTPATPTITTTTTSGTWTIFFAEKKRQFDVPRFYLEPRGHVGLLRVPFWHTRTRQSILCVAFLCPNQKIFHRRHRQTGHGDGLDSSLERHAIPPWSCSPRCNSDTARRKRTNQEYVIARLRVSLVCAHLFRKWTLATDTGVEATMLLHTT